MQQLLARVTDMALTLDAAVQRHLHGQALAGGGCVDYDVLSRELHRLHPFILRYTRRLPLLLDRGLE
jgi:hypothetical protein